VEDKNMTREKALQLAQRALDMYKRAETKAEVEEIFIKYGREGIGYKPLCRMFYSHMTPENAVRIRNRE
jgi:hypothetical protein